MVDSIFPHSDKMGGGVTIVVLLLLLLVSAVSLFAGHLSDSRG